MQDIWSRLWPLSLLKRVAAWSGVDGSPLAQGGKAEGSWARACAKRGEGPRKRRALADANMKFSARVEGLLGWWRGREAEGREDYGIGYCRDVEMSGRYQCYRCSIAPPTCKCLMSLAVRSHATVHFVHVVVFCHCRVGIDVFELLPRPTRI